jgi:hypothetical protein
MKIAVIIPDRGDRPEFTEHCLKMIKSQLFPSGSRYVVDVILDNDTPENEDCDITKRYRRSYKKACGKDYDCILFMENDDYYSPFYIYTMVSEWVSHGKPILFGTNYTRYYHIGLLKYRDFKHNKRSSMMSTLIVPDLDIEWPEDDEPYTDKYLWAQFYGRSVVFKPETTICLGIKHNIGKTGGWFHGDRFHAYRVEDVGMSFLQSVTGEDFQFYKNLHEKVQSNFRSSDIEVGKTI